MDYLKKLLSIGLILIMCTGCSSSIPDSAQTVPETTPPEQVEALNEVIVTTHTTSKETRVFSVGTHVSLNKQGLITQIKEKYETLYISYDDAGNITKIKMTKNESGNVGYEKWTYEDGTATAREFRPNDDFWPGSDATITFEKDASNKPIAMVENVTNTNQKDQSKSESQRRTEYSYNALGQISEISFYINGELDHIGKITYNQNGRIIKYSCIGVSAMTDIEYLRLEFTYHMVDKNDYEIVIPDAFTEYFNCEKLLGRI